MAEHSKIAWTDHTFNPWFGCTKVSPGCDNCYAEGWSKRSGMVSWGPGQRRRTSAANWKNPLKWDATAKIAGTRAKVFCASLADVFDNDRSITSGWRGDLWHMIEATPNLDWLLLTKRPQNIKKMLPQEYGATAWGQGWPNVWLGTTAENQTEADRRIPHLLDIDARVHFVSAEPLISELDLTAYLHDSDCDHVRDDYGINYQCTCEYPRERHVGWVIAGGESGSGFRPMQMSWADSLMRQCRDASAAFFFKQTSGSKPGQRGNASDDLWGKKEFPK